MTEIIIHVTTEEKLEKANQTIVEKNDVIERLEILLEKEKAKPQPKVRLKKNGMTATPVDVDALAAYIAKFSGPEALVAFTVSGMTWNLASELTKPEKEEEE